VRPFGLGPAVACGGNEKRVGIEVVRHTHVLYYQQIGCLGVSGLVGVLYDKPCLPDAEGDPPASPEEVVPDTDLAWAAHRKVTDFYVRSPPRHGSAVVLFSPSPVAVTH